MARAEATELSDFIKAKSASGEASARPKAKSNRCSSFILAGNHRTQSRKSEKICLAFCDCVSYYYTVSGFGSCFLSLSTYDTLIELTSFLNALYKRKATHVVSADNEVARRTSAARRATADPPRPTARAGRHLAARPDARRSWAQHIAPSYCAVLRRAWHHAPARALGLAYKFTARLSSQTLSCRALTFHL